MSSRTTFKATSDIEGRLESSDGPSAVPNPESGERCNIYLLPGQIFASSEPCTVTTILGSCVAVCVWDPVLRMGGVNHYLLPYWVGNGVSSGRFGNVAIKQLINKLVTLGSKKRNLQAKLFGGACVLEAMRDKEEHLGVKNIQVARKLLGEEGIPVVSDDVGGSSGRKLIFHTDKGTALVRRL